MRTVGVALFATFSGFLANAFLSPRKRARGPESTDPIAELRALLEQQEQASARTSSRSSPGRRRGGGFTRVTEVRLRHVSDGRL